MNSQDLILTMMRAQGKTDALSLRSRSAGMDGTAIIAEEEKIPAFNPEKDYSSWPAGAPVTDEGQVWTLIQPYNAANYDGRPSTLRALWGLAHTKNPVKAKPYVAPFGTAGFTPRTSAAQTLMLKILQLCIAANAITTHIPPAPIPQTGNW